MKARSPTRNPPEILADPGASVVAALGGPTRVARLLGISPSTAWRWTLPRSARGTGGIIPAQYHATLQRLADRVGVQIDLDAPTSRVTVRRQTPVMS